MVETPSGERAQVLTRIGRPMRASPAEQPPFGTEGQFGTRASTSTDAPCLGFCGFDLELTSAVIVAGESRDHRLGAIRGNVDEAVLIT